MEIAFHADIHRLAGMAGQRHAVAGAPLAERPVIGLFQAERDGPPILGAAQGRIDMVVIPQVGQVGREIVAQNAVDLLQDAGRPRHGTGNPRLVGENRQDGIAKVLAELGRVAVVDQMEKTGRGRRIENIAGGLQLLFRMASLLQIVEAANGAAGRPIDHCHPLSARPLDGGHQIRAGL